MTRACILGCAGPSLGIEERAFYRDADPFGLILFARNVETPGQVRALVDDFRSIVGRDDAPVLIDQEGGRVQRLRPPHWREFPPAARLAECAGEDAGEAVRLGSRLIASELAGVGINVDCLPVADLRHSGAHDIIGDRAYGADPARVARLARAAAEGLLDGGVLPVVKHIPGHGRAKADSHLELPVVDTPHEELERTDFEPFRRLNDLPIAMTAHVVYSAIDPDRPATLSPAVVADVIRGSIGFGGLLLTDDLSMKALTGSFRERTEAAIAAGCDIALHCNGQADEMEAVVEGSPDLAGKAAERAAAALRRLRQPGQRLNVAEAWTRFSAMLSA